MAEYLTDLQARARAGDPRALATWGRVLITGAGGVPITLAGVSEGLACLRDAMHRGDAEAPATLAMMPAFGILEPRNLGLALQLLETSAQRGWAPAQRQLQVLGRAEGDDWAALRRAAAGANLRHAPAARVLNERPHLRVFENFATEPECDWLIGRVRDHLERAQLYHAAREISERRTNSEASMMPHLLDVVSGVVLQRVAAAVGVDLAFCEFATVLHYLPGQLFGPHTDYFDPAMAVQLQEIQKGGQRIATFLVYLSEDYEDGETEFLDINLKYKGRKGDALMFVNVDGSGAPDYATSHQGSAPTSGEKWVLSQWVRSIPLNAYMTPGGEKARLPQPWPPTL